MKATLIRCVLGLSFLASAGCPSHDSASDQKEARSAGGCREPENPYAPGSGHYAGFEWAEEKAPSTCGDNSDSFIEGCEEYERQADAYKECSSHR
jgi:hypothetical protein